MSNVLIFVRHLEQFPEMTKACTENCEALGGRGSRGVKNNESCGGGVISNGSVSGRVRCVFEVRSSQVGMVSPVTGTVLGFRKCNWCCNDPLGVEIPLTLL